MSESTLKRKSLDASSPVASTSQPALALDKEARKKAKKRRKEEERALVQPPSFQFNTNGLQKKIGIAHLRDFALHLVADNTKNPDWMLVNNKRHLASVTVLFVPGITPSALGMPELSVDQTLPLALPHLAEAKLPIMQQLFSHACPVRSPGDRTRLHSVLGIFLSSPLPPKEKERRENERKLKLKSTSTPTTSPSLYLLTRQEMIDNDYPIPTILSPLSDPLDAGEIVCRDQEIIKSPPRVAYKDAFGQKKDAPVVGDAGWVETKIKDGESQPDEGGLMHCLALDCEMCMTAEGPFLARISVIDAQTKKKVYDTVVRPPGPVTDYLTQWSGITAEALSHATLSLADVQKYLLDNLITSRTILIGHSLESDLKAMKLRHPWVIDTAVLFKHPKGPPFKPGLKYLAKTLLEKDIQQNIGGHDPEEDARTCMELLELKLKLGPEFGTQEESESIFRRVGRQPRLAPAMGNKQTAMFDRGVSNFLASSHDVTTTKNCENDDEVIEGLVQNVATHDFLFGRLTEYSDSLGWSSKHNAHLASLPAGSPASLTSDEVVPLLNDRIARLHASLPSRSALIVFTGHSDPRLMLALQARHAAWQKAFKVKPNALTKEERWMEDDERALQAEVEKCRQGLAFFLVK